MNTYRSDGTGFDTDPLRDSFSNQRSTLLTESEYVTPGIAAPGGDDIAHPIPPDLNDDDDMGGEPGDDGVDPMRWPIARPRIPDPGIMGPPPKGPAMKAPPQPIIPGARPKGPAP